MPDTMNALVFTGTGALELQKRTVPRPTENEVQIEIKAVSICGSDLGAYRHATDRFKPPLVLGHEFSGVVSGLGDGVSDLQIGQRVAVNPMLYCGECYHCKRGEVNLCGHRRSLGTAIGGTQTDGAMRQYMTVRRSAVLPLRDELSFRDGALLEPMGVCLACAKCGYTLREETVVIIGAGPIGLLIVKFLQAMGVKNIIVSDVMDTRLQKAKVCGATHTVNAASESVGEAIAKVTAGVGADRVIIAAGVAPAIAQSLELVRNGGTVVLVALMHDNVELDPMQIVGRGVKFLGSYMFTSEMEEAMHMLADGKLTVSDLVTSTFPLEEGKKAFDLLMPPGNTEIKVQLTVN